MPRSHIDHIAVTAPSLQSGAEFVHSQLGVMPLPGGEHPRMGTHNLLLRLGESVYLEVIAIKPDTAAPGRPRWFGLDTLTVGTPPRLATWIARSSDILASAAASSEVLGQVEPMSRGALNWKITVPQDGALVLGGIAPALIGWEPGTHPATRMQDLGLALIGLELFHPEPERITALLHSLDMHGPVSVSALAAGATPYLVAHIDTPQGPRRLSGCQRF
ncbi:MAG: VOC family protein [Pseudomonadota bacterium]